MWWEENSFFYSSISLQPKTLDSKMIYVYIYKHTAKELYISFPSPNSQT